jgi:acyl-CoA dehydrogenase
MDFSTPDHIQDLVKRTRTFIAAEIIPYESDPRWGEHGPSEDLRAEMNAKAKAAGLFAPHAPTEFGGLGLSHLERSWVFEEAGYSLLGPSAMHCGAPDEGNIHLLNEVASPEQREKYLKPLAQGARSCFAMTEPDGAGADPTMLATTAKVDGNGYVINGRKWFITGANDSTFVIIMAKIEGGPHDGEATMFLAPMDDPAIVLESQMDTLDTSFAGGHWNMRFDDLRVDADAVLGAPGAGFRYAQVRLAPARLTHCMRWLGSARRAHDTAADYANTRMAFGQILGKHEGVGFMLADNEMDMRTARLSLQQAAWLLDQGERAAEESSMAKVQCSEAIWRIVDNSVQILGGAGTSAHLPVERIFREVRGFRIYDGPSEVHRWSLARKALKRAAERKAG